MPVTRDDDNNNNNNNNNNANNNNSTTIVGSISALGDTFQILVEMNLRDQATQASLVLEAKLRVRRIHF